MDWMFRVVPWFIGFVFVLIISIWIVGGILAYKTINAVNENGLRSLAEQVWCGKEADCKLPWVK